MKLSPKRLLLIVMMLTVLTGWNLEESLQAFGEGVRTGVSNTEEAFKEAPGAISEAANKVEDDVREDDASSKNNSETTDQEDTEKDQ